MPATSVRDDGAAAPWRTPEFTERLRAVAEERHHDRHPFNLRMHRGELTSDELCPWIANRFHHQRHIPVKDALILTRFDDPSLRRARPRRIQDHDGVRDGEGGIERRLRLGEAADLTRDQRPDLPPGIRPAVEGYANLCRLSPALDAVAASLTELPAPALCAPRIAAFERHSPWIAADGLAHFRIRIGQGGCDGEEALALVRAFNAHRGQDSMRIPAAPAPCAPPTSAAAAARRMR